MDIAKKAVELLARGYNCAQAVFASAGEYTGLDEKTALAIASGFGGGLRCGEVCGAVSGAVMALGQVFPFNDSEDAAAKAKIAELSRELCGEFKSRFDAIRCDDIMGDHSRCNEYIAAAAEMLEKYINNYKGE